MTLGKRLEKLLIYFIENKLAVNKQDFCLKLGIDSTSLSKYLSDKFKFAINESNIANFSHYKIDLNWLLTGEGEMFISGSKAADADVLVCGGTTRIPLLRQRVSCGLGQNWEHEQNIAEYIDIRDLAPRMLNERVYAFRAAGTSMLGAGIKDGDIILFCDSPDQQLIDGIYVFALDGDTYCKRLEFDPIAARIKIYSMRTADLEAAELLTTLTSTDSGYAERFCLFGRVFSWIHSVPLELP